MGIPLTRAIDTRGGTLVISWANVAEFRSLDRAGAVLAEVLIEENLPRVFFLDCDPFDVIEREGALIAGGPAMAPHADLDLLRLVIGLRPSGLPPITCIGMLTAVSEQRVESVERMQATFVERMNNLREEYLEDDDFRKLVDRSIRDQRDPHGTPIILRELVASLLRDRRTGFTRNDAMDFFHTVVPAAYCDYVLLDGRWRDQVDRLRLRLERVDRQFPLAEALSGGSAVRRLIERLEQTRDA
jgi:hypothetical protein